METPYQPRAAVSFEFHPDGPNQWHVSTPFYLDDGDGLAVILRRFADRLELTDQAHTRMRMGLLAPDWPDSTIARICAMHCLSERDGEFIATATEENLGERLIEFTQALLRLLNPAPTEENAHL